MFYCPAVGALNTSVAGSGVEHPPPQFNASTPSVGTIIGSLLFS